MGWTKPEAAVVVLPEKDEPVLSGVVVAKGNSSSGSGSVYMPPSARSVAAPPAVVAFPPLEKAPVLRGEDFPSLRAALPSATTASQKQKEGSSQKQKQVVGDELSYEQRNGLNLGGSVDMRPQVQSSRDGSNNGFRENEGKFGGGGSRALEQVRKPEEYFPLVRVNPRSDWADDERDTSYGLVDRGRDHGFSKSEAYWDRDFDMPRLTVLPHKPVQNVSERWGQRDDEAGKVASSEVPKRDPQSRDGRVPSREGREANLWKSSPLPKDGSGAVEAGARPSSMNRESHRENKYAPSPFRESWRDDFGRRDGGYGQGGKQPWHNATDSYVSRGSDWNMRDRHGNEQHNRYRDGSFQNNSTFKSSYSSNGRGMPLNDPILNFGKEKRHFSKTEKPYVEDPFMKDFGATDPLSGGLLGVVKRKKDVLKQIDFHDPVRESFEAELERVQKMQEQERRRVVEEQERVLELARREEEERARLVREQEDRQRKMEDEAREAVWRAEQERLEATRRAEEQRIAREEEKLRIFSEEERRKHAAKQMLQELEERMAKRHSEPANSGTSSPVLTDEQLSLAVKEKDASRALEVGDWEEGERMVERITTSASSDSSSLNRPLDMGSRSQFSRDSSAFLDRGKSFNSWRRDTYDNGNSSGLQYQDHDFGHHSQRRDMSVGGRTYSTKEFYGGPGSMPPRTYHKGVSEPLMDDFAQLKGQRWNLSGVGDHGSRNQYIDPEINDQFVEKFGKASWGQNRSRGNSYSQYPERPYPNSEADGPYSYERPRYSMRQPRVLPPPAIASVHKSSYRSEVERSSPSTYLESEIQYNHATRNDSTTHTAYGIAHRENIGQPELINVLQENEQKLDGKTTPRCDSQSSLSVSSPPSSPAHLSHEEDLDESGESSVLSGEGDSKDVSVSGHENEAVGLSSNGDKENTMTDEGCASEGEDEEWTVDNNEQQQEQEVYDEDEDGYEEEDEVHEGDDDLLQGFVDNMHLEEKESSDMMDMVLGFNEGVQVGMPHDDTVPQAPSDTIDGICCDAKTLGPLDGSSQVTIDSSLRMFQESENGGMQDLVIQRSNTPHLTAESKLLDHVNASSISLSSHHSVVYPLNLAPSSSGPAVISGVPAVPKQAEVPIKLQFGLFSGPSLIPSPVSAIQIGSIQMPLPLHPHVGTSLSHMHPPQPLFQFGQLRYTSPISQGMMALPHQPMPYVQPSVPSSFPFSQTLVGPLPTQPSQESSSLSTENKVAAVSKNIKEDNSLLAREKTETLDIGLRGRSEVSYVNDSTRSKLGTQEGHSDLGVKNYNALSSTPGDQPLLAEALSHIGGPKVQGSNGRGKRFAVTVKNSGTRPFHTIETNRSESSGYQRRPRRNIPRTEFRVRESADKKQSAGLVSSDDLGVDEKLNPGAKGAWVSARHGPRKVILSHKAPTKQALQSEISSSVLAITRETDSATKAENGSGKDKVHVAPLSGEGKHKRNICEDDVDAPLQSGVVRVFQQPGIEAPSDEDDFIEVRSKRQMLNDRREQREKEIKAKSRVLKVPRKSRSTTKPISSANTDKVYASSSGGAAASTRPDYVSTEGRGLTATELSTRLNTSAVSQPLAPIGTPAVKCDSQTIRPVQTSSNTLVSSSTKHLRPGSAYDNKTKVVDSVQPSLNSWDTSRVNQQVMALTQTQLDEAMKPGQFDSRASAAKDAGSVKDSNMSSSSILTKDKPFSSGASPVNSLLAGEKIQFGAVTSPTILPPSSRVVSHGIGALGPRSEVQLSHNLSGPDNNDCNLLFDKEKRTAKSCVHLEDCEAEAAASAVAVAAISSDEIVGNGLGSCPVSVSDTNSYGGPSIGGISTDGKNNERFTTRQSRAEESLIVSLPADLSVETPPISMWPPLPSPPNSSNQMLSHFPGGPPSHYPFYEMNPMMGSPVFAFGPHDESASAAQSQSQKSTVPASAPLGAWQQCHTGVDSFYGPPAGFTAPFISPPGVPGPPHMVVYNHFAPVGQFGQVGLSFMGTTYIPSGKQLDWKHSPASSPMVVGEAEMNNLNMVPGQRNPATIPAPIQHLAPGSPLLPMPNPMAMFDVSPFQSSPDMSVQARWPHVQASSIQSVPLSMSLQQQPDKLSHAPIDQSKTPNRFPESRNSTPSDKYPATTNASVTQLSNELGLVHPSSSTMNSSFISMNSETVKSEVNGSTNAPNVKTQPSQHKANLSSQQHGPSSGYGYHRGGSASHRNNSGSDWNHRRTGFQGRNPSLGGEKGYHSSKLKQIYVAKQTNSASVPSTTTS